MHQKKVTTLLDDTIPTIFNKMKMSAKQTKLAGILLIGLVVTFRMAWQLVIGELMLAFACLIRLFVLAYIFIIVNRQP